MDATSPPSSAHQNHSRTPPNFLSGHACLLPTYLKRSGMCVSRAEDFMCMTSMDGDSAFSRPDCPCCTTYFDYLT
ncbi:Uncharacterized protein TCM_028865 [Theobroma cacao]|uniref:Uncharacterized protein n=1 Tax=Theobroma cacao TaxID=3641 RepID=A0A061GBW0_THECC|nr:Uncharacterized protein TCM_028865 [Theobroma cacao]